MDITPVWVLGFFPVWVLGIIDYHGSRLVRLEALRWPTAVQVTDSLERTLVAEGAAPARVLTDRGLVFRSDLFEAMLARHGIEHSMTRAYHPWTNGRIVRLFRTFKDTIRSC